MNPALIIIVLLGVVAVWFLASSAFVPLGKMFHKVGKNIVDNMNSDGDGDENETTKEKDEVEE